ncbi:hypothetical protein Salat_0668200 [Sesamum alatum]|uniref:CCHC-type domain-containing protein n=1 Tax=Sesamum alatum TaxID=300844 RepID=A0AAE2CUK0_9LAMI|nr:hypothetical protein Salat_0668200 [Sesamum alatum]
MVMIRAERHLKIPPPAYHPDTQSLTVAIYSGGELRNLPVATCIGGTLKKFDYVNGSHMNKRTLDCIAEKYGISVEGIRYYIIKNGGFKLLYSDEDILEQALNHLESREFTVYIEQNPPQPEEVAVECGLGKEKGKKHVSDSNDFEFLGSGVGDNGMQHSDSLEEGDEDVSDSLGKKVGKTFKLRRQPCAHHCTICGEVGHNAKGCALWKDMQQPGIEDIEVDGINTDHTALHSGKKKAASSSNLRPRKHHKYVDPSRVNVVVSETEANIQQHVLPPIVPDEVTNQVEDSTTNMSQTILTEPRPHVTQVSQQGPSMYEQLQMGQSTMPMPPQTSLQPRLNIRVPPPMTG